MSRNICQFSSVRTDRLSLLHMLQVETRHFHCTKPSPIIFPFVLGIVEIELSQSFSSSLTSAIQISELTSTIFHKQLF